MIRKVALPWHAAPCVSLHVWCVPSELRENTISIRDKLRTLEIDSISHMQCDKALVNGSCLNIPSTLANGCSAFTSQVFLLHRDFASLTTSYQLMMLLSLWLWMQCSLLIIWRSFGLPCCTPREALRMDWRIVDFSFKVPWLQSWLRKKKLASYM